MPCRISCSGNWAVIVATKTVYSAPVFQRPGTDMASAMAKQSKGNKPTGGTVAQNRRARHDYFLEQKFEAGIALQGWEVKSIRDGRVQLTDAFVTLHKGEAYLASANITPLSHASTHVVAEPQRLRKLLLHTRELAQIFAATQQKGYSCIPTALYWKGNKIKCEIALGKGKKQHDKRASTREKDWQRDKQRLMKSGNR